MISLVEPYYAYHSSLRWRNTRPNIFINGPTLAIVDGPVVLHPIILPLVLLQISIIEVLLFLSLCERRRQREEREAAQFSILSNRQSPLLDFAQSVELESLSLLSFET